MSITIASSAITSGESVRETSRWSRWLICCEGFFVGRDQAFGPVLFKAAAGTRLGFCGEKKFEIGIGKNDAADIAALEYTAVRSREPDLSLMIDHNAPDARDRRDDRRCLSDLERADLSCHVLPSRITCIASGSPTRSIFAILGVFVNPSASSKLVPVVKSRNGNRAVHRPRVEIKQAELFCEHFAKRRFSGTGGPVDSDDHQIDVFSS